MLKAALESLKRKGDTQMSTQKQEKTPLEDSPSPLSSQLSALLFSSSPPTPKQVKIEITENSENIDRIDDLDELDDLLKDLEGDEEELFTVQTMVKGDDQKVKALTLDYCTEKQQEEVIYSAVDSGNYSAVPDSRYLPMIDISTPQVFSQKHQWEISDTLDEVDDKYEGHWTQSGWKVMLPETFNLEHLRENIKGISPSLHLSPIEAIRASGERRITFPVALMLRDFRQIGSMAQLRLLDAAGQEIVGTLTFSACTELGIKLHFGLVLILVNVSVFEPVPGQKYLNITKQNIQSYHYNSITLQ